MEFKEAMRAWERMCAAQNECEICPCGENCLLSLGFENIGVPELEKTLEKWAEEHPEKTIADDFFERCPNAMKDDMETPYACAKHCGYHAPTYCERIPQRCAECWRRPLEEVER